MLYTGKEFSVGITFIKTAQANILVVSPNERYIENKLDGSMDLRVNLAELVLYLCYVTVLSGVAACHFPPKQRNTGCLGLAYIPAFLGAIGSVFSILEHQFASTSDFFKWLLQATEPAYGKTGFAGYMWNGFALLYVIAPIVIYLMTKFIQSSKLCSRVWMKPPIDGEGAS